MALNIADLVKQAVQATITPLDDSTRERLQQHLDLQKAIGNREVTTDDLSSALKDGWTPDFYVGDDAEINFTGTLTSVTSLEVGANGAVTLGPAQVGVNLGYKTSETNTGTISGTIRTHRESRSQGVQYAMSVLQPMETPALPEAPDQPVVTPAAIPAAPKAATSTPAKP